MNNTIVGNIAFFDAEYTALSAHNRGIQEMIQCAFLIYNAEFQTENNTLLKMSDAPIFIYKTFTKPLYNQSLSEYIQELTNIKQEDIDNGDSFESTLDHICELCSQYKIKNIITWGPDKILLRENCNMVNYDQHKAKKLCNKFKDVSKLISDKLGYWSAISQHKVCNLLHIEEEGELHDAYYDALNLSKIIKKFCDTKSHKI